MDETKSFSISPKLVVLIFNAQSQLALSKRFNRFNICSAVINYLDNKYHDQDRADAKMAQLGIQKTGDLLTKIDCYMMLGGAFASQTDTATGVLHLTRHPVVPSNVELPITGISVDGYRHEKKCLQKEHCLIENQKQAPILGDLPSKKELGQLKQQTAVNTQIKVKVETAHSQITERSVLETSAVKETMTYEQLDLF